MLFIMWQTVGASLPKLLPRQIKRHHASSQECRSEYVQRTLCDQIARTANRFRLECGGSGECCREIKKSCLRLGIKQNISTGRKNPNTRKPIWAKELQRSTAKIVNKKCEICAFAIAHFGECRHTNHVARETGNNLSQPRLD